MLLTFVIYIITIFELGQQVTDVDEVQIQITSMILKVILIFESKNLLTNYNLVNKNLKTRENNNIYKIYIAKNKILDS